MMLLYRILAHHHELGERISHDFEVSERLLREGLTLADQQQLVAERALSDAALDTIVEYARKLSTPQSDILISHLGGVINYDPTNLFRLNQNIIPEERFS